MEMMIHLESENGHYVAQVMGYPESRVEAASCEAALAAVGSSIRQRVDNGEIFLLSFPNESTCSPSLTRKEPKRIKSIRDVFGMFKDDESLEELRELMRREREEELKREFGE